MVALLTLWAGAAAGEPKLKIGDSAPKLQTGKWIQGEPVNGFEKGKAYIVEFWATWCGPCRVSIPHLNEIHSKYKNRGLVVIGQDVWEDNDSAVEPFVKKMGDKMSYRVALDEKPVIDGKADPNKGKMAENWMSAAGQPSIPMAFLVDTNGIVSWIDHPMGLTDELIESVLSGKYDLKRAVAEFLEEYKDQENWRVAEVPVGKFHEALKQKDWNEALERLAEAEKLLSKRNSNSLRLQMLLAKRDYAAVLDFAEKLYRKPAQENPPQTKAVGALNEIAWRMAVDQTISPADLAHAETAANWADDATKNKDANIIDTLARIRFRRGKKDEAIALQEKAVRLTHESPMFLKTLESYRKGELPKTN